MCSVMYIKCNLQCSKLTIQNRTYRIVSSLQWRHKGRDCVSNHQHHQCLLNRLFGRRSKKTSKLRVTGLCAGNSPGTGEFPTQMASNVENVSIWWRHHGVYWIIRYWHDAKYSTGHRITIWALKQNGRTMRLKVQYLAIWYHIENLLHLYKSCLQKFRETLSWTFSKYDLYKWSRFSLE